uniref:Uncharacterized protein n=1 Tax=Glossina morsitans morsitans TaxID=37546 RepID=A0A1B0FDD1_GLOMM
MLRQIVLRHLIEKNRTFRQGNISANDSSFESGLQIRVANKRCFTDDIHTADYSFMTLELLVSGGYLWLIGNDYSLNVPHRTLSDAALKIIEAVDAKICPKWIRWSNNVDKQT